MTVLKGAEIERFVAEPDPRRPVILVYGPDMGLVSERARAIATRIAPDLDDPFSVTRIDGDVLASDPARLADEAGTVPMFGGRRLIWVKAGDKPIAAAVSPLLANPPEGATILIEAGDLKKSVALRSEAERASSAAVIACYADGEADLKRLAMEEAKQAWLQFEPQALALLVQYLGGDRAASRAEIRKICLYAHGTGTIRAADIIAVAGESLAMGVDEIIDAAFGGAPDEVDRLLLRAEAAGIAIPQIVAAASRHALAMHKVRLIVESGTPVRVAVERFEPPVFFRRKPAVERQLGLWTSTKLARIIQRLAEAGFETRAKAAIAPTLVGRLLISIASNARQGARG